MRGDRSAGWQGCGEGWSQEGGCTGRWTQLQNDFLGEQPETFSLCEMGIDGGREAVLWIKWCLSREGRCMGEKRDGLDLSKVGHLILNKVPEANRTSQPGNFTPQVGTLRL